MELELLELQFPKYTPEVRECISDVVLAQRCADTSDAVIDGLWKTCRDDLTSLLLDSGVDLPVTSEFDNPELPPTAREIVRTFVDQARSYQGKLADIDDDEEFGRLYRGIVQPRVKAKRDRQAQIALKDDRFSFINQPQADADYARWRSRLLSPAQATALSFGKDPDVVTPESLQGYKRLSGSPFREAFKDRLDLIEAAAAAGDVGVPMSVSSFVTWAVSRGLDVPPQLNGTLPLTAEQDAAFWKARFEAAQKQLNEQKDKLPTQTRRTLYRIILGMAIARFKHRTGPRSDATTQIFNELEKLGLNVSDGTIRDHLTSAADELEFEWPRKDRE